MSAEPARSSPFVSPDWMPILLGQGVGVVCGLLGTRLTSCLVPAELLGSYGLFLTLAPAGSLFTHAGLAKHAAREWPGADRPAYLQTLLRESIRPTVALTLFAIMAAVISFSVQTRLGHTSIWFWLWVANVGAAYALIFQSALQGARLYWADLILSSVTSVGRTFLPLLAFLVLGASLPNLTAGFGLHALAAMICAVFLVRLYSGPRTSANPSRPNRASWNEYHFAFAAAGGLTFLNTAVNRWIGAAIYDDAALGWFTLAGNLAIVLPNVLSAAAWQFFFPRLVQADEAGTEPRRVLAILDRALGLFLLAALLGAGAIWLVLPWLIGTLIDVRYASALRFILPLYGYGVALAVAFYCQGLLVAARAPRAALGVSVVAALLFCLGGAAAAAYSSHTFVLWLAFSPIPALLLLRPLSRRFYLRTRAGLPFAKTGSSA